MDSEKDVEATAGAHGLRGGSAEQRTLTENESKQHPTTSKELKRSEKAEEAQMEERKSFDDTEEGPDSEPYQEVSSTL